MIDADIKTSIRYFLQFSYAPSLDEIYMFMPSKQKRDVLQKTVSRMVKKGTLEQIDCGDNVSRYTLGGYSLRLKEQKNRIKTSLVKRNRVVGYVNLISKLHCVQLIGLSGSVAMNNAGAGDDIDLFIIARAHRMFTARFWLVLLAYLYGQKRSKNASKLNAVNKICLNMFLDETNMQMPKNKQTYYVGHEVLQMKPLVNKNNTHERFLDANNWVYKLFPNASQKTVTRVTTQSNSKRSRGGDIFESLLKQLQLWKINKGKTTEIITDTQLWFFPHDFELKLQ